MFEQFPQQVLEVILSALSSKSDPVAIYDDQDLIVFCNDAYAELNATPSNKLMGMHWGDACKITYQSPFGIFIETEDIDAWLQAANKKRRSSQNRTFEIDTKDGRWFLCTEYCHENGYLFFHATENTRNKLNELALKKASLHLKKLANEDELTGLYNRRYFNKAFNEQLQDSQGSSFCLLLFDIDFFKDINDNFGHATGDEVLRQLSMFLTTQIRPYDILARIGGEEFALILPSTSTKQGKAIAERLRLKIQEMDFLSQQTPLHLTVSLGGVSVEKGRSHTSMNAVFKVADEALYAAKHGGRNLLKWGRS